MLILYINKTTVMYAYPNAVSNMQNHRIRRCHIRTWQEMITTMPRRMISALFPWIIHRRIRHHYRQHMQVHMLLGSHDHKRHTCLVQRIFSYKNTKTQTQIGHIHTAEHNHCILILHTFALYVNIHCSDFRTHQLNTTVYSNQY